MIINTDELIETIYREDVSSRENIEKIIKRFDNPYYHCSECSYFDKNWTYCSTEVHYCKLRKCGEYDDAFCSRWMPR